MKRYALDQKMKSMFTAAFLAVLLAAAGLFAWLSSSIYRRQSYQLCVSQAELNLNILDSRLQQIQTKQRLLAADPVIREAVEYQTENDPVDYAIELYHQRDVADKLYMLSENPEIENAYIVDAAGRCLYTYRASVRKDYDLMQEEWLKKIVDSIYLNTSYVSGMHSRRYLLSDAESECISMVMPITKENQYAFAAAAYLVCDINPMAILQPAGAVNGGVSFALLADGHMLYSKDGLRLTQEEERRILERDGEDNYSFLFGEGMFGPKRLAVVIKSRFFGWNLVGIRPLEEIRSVNLKLAAMLVTASLAGCGGTGKTDAGADAGAESTARKAESTAAQAEEKQEEAPEAKEGEQVTLRLMAYNAETTRATYLKYLEEKFPNIKIEFKKIAGAFS